MRKQLAERFLSELTGFFLHTRELTTHWSVKEKYHLLEVRNILDTLALTAIIAVILLFLTFEKKRLAYQAKLNVFVTGSLIVLIPFFKFFWRDVFHPLLFNNKLWLNTPRDVSFYIMPGVFFKYSMIFFVFAAIAINAAIWFVFRHKESKIDKKVTKT